MKSLFPTILFLSFSSFCFAQQPTIVVTNAAGTSSAVYHLLKDAIKNASAGSFLYLSGGVFTNILNDTIDKELHLIGAGYHPNYTLATSPTNITNRIVINVEAKGSTLEGLNINAITLRQYVEGIVFKRVYFSTSNNTFDYYLKNLSFYECIFRGHAGNNGVLSENCTLKNCIITAGSSFKLSTFENCLFTDAFGYYIQNTYKNNIFRFNQSSISFNSNNIFYNNIFDCTVNFASSETNVGNYQNVNITTLYPIFVANTTYTFSISHDFRFVESSAFKNETYGIYGGTLPFKESGIPSNPHIETKMISGQTDASGNLNVKVTVKAQSN